MKGKIERVSCFVFFMGLFVLCFPQKGHSYEICVTNELEHSIDANITTRFNMTVDGQHDAYFRQPIGSGKTICRSYTFDNAKLASTVFLGLRISGDIRQNEAKASNERQRTGDRHWQNCRFQKSWPSYQPLSNILNEIRTTFQVSNRGTVYDVRPLGSDRADCI